MDTKFAHQFLNGAVGFLKPKSTNFKLPAKRPSLNFVCQLTDGIVQTLCVALNLQFVFSIINFMA